MVDSKVQDIYDDFRKIRNSKGYCSNLKSLLKGVNKDGEVKDRSMSWISSIIDSE
jgi:hypothetical protein